MTFLPLEQITTGYKDFVGLLKEKAEFIADRVFTINCASTKKGL